MNIMTLKNTWVEIFLVNVLRDCMCLKDWDYDYSTNMILSVLIVL